MKLRCERALLALCLQVRLYCLSFRLSIESEAKWQRSESALVVSPLGLPLATVMQIDSPSQVFSSSTRELFLEALAVTLYLSACVIIHRVLLDLIKIVLKGLAFVSGAKN